MHREKAQKGLNLIKESIKELLIQNRQGLSSTEIAEVLGLQSESDQGRQKGWLCWSFLQILKNEESIRKEGQGRGSRYFINE